MLSAECKLTIRKLITINTLLSIKIFCIINNRQLTANIKSINLGYLNAKQKLSVVNNTNT